MAKDYILDAKMHVVQLFNAFRNEGVPEIKPENTYVVWYNQTLHTWKAFVTTIFPDNMFYEVTYDTKTGQTTIGIFSKEQEFTVGGDDENPDQLTLLIEEVSDQKPETD